ncbi:unnamed protein product [Acanthosepion pharaonis]|uniref:Uncharacterized protein n=1 Tax=Acanthosepion pharaonis TaxID=158019 RepID=A0A812E9V0_ACAPH|nr:unnamed protein product [Sepia pharaonis]
MSFHSQCSERFATETYVEFGRGGRYVEFVGGDLKPDFDSLHQRPFLFWFSFFLIPPLSVTFFSSLFLSTLSLYSSHPSSSTFSLFFLFNLFPPPFYQPNFLFLLLILCLSSFLYLPSILFLILLVFLFHTHIFSSLIFYIPFSFLILSPPSINLISSFSLSFSFFLSFFLHLPSTLITKKVFFLFFSIFFPIHSLPFLICFVFFLILYILFPILSHFLTLLPSYFSPQLPNCSPTHSHLVAMTTYPVSIKEYQLEQSAKTLTLKMAKLNPHLQPRHLTFSPT